MKKQVLVFGHSDLDGAGVQIIGEAIAQAQGLPCETYRCSYHDANSKIMEAIRQYTPQGIAQILTANQFKDMFKSNLNMLSGGSVGIRNLGLYSQQSPHKRG